MADEKYFMHTNSSLSFGCIITQANADCNEQRLLLEEKLSPQVTDEVRIVCSNTSSTANAVPLPLKGKAFPVGKSYSSKVDDEKSAF